MKPKGPIYCIYITQRVPSTPSWLDSKFGRSLIKPKQTLRRPAQAILLISRSRRFRVSFQKQLFCMVGSITVPPTPFLIIVWDKYSDSVIVARLVSFQQKGGGGNPVEWIQMVGHHHPPPPRPVT